MALEMQSGREGGNPEDADYLISDEVDHPSRPASLPPLSNRLIIATNAFARIYERLGEKPSKRMVEARQRFGGRLGDSNHLKEAKALLREGVYDGSITLIFYAADGKRYALLLSEVKALRILRDRGFLTVPSNSLSQNARSVVRDQIAAVRLTAQLCFARRQFDRFLKAVKSNCRPRIDVEADIKSRSRKGQGPSVGQIMDDYGVKQALARLQRKNAIPAGRGRPKKRGATKHQK